MVKGNNQLWKDSSYIYKNGGNVIYFFNVYFYLFTLTIVA